MPFSAKIVGDELVLRIPMNAKPEKSSGGKTLVVASTYGNKETDCVADGPLPPNQHATFYATFWRKPDIFRENRQSEPSYSASFSAGRLGRRTRQSACDCDPRQRNSVSPAVEMLTL